MSFQFWRRWLIVATCGVIVYGFSFILFPDLTQSLFNIIFFGSADASQSFSNEANAYIAFAHGVLGAVMIGWMVALLPILLGPFGQGQRSAWNAIAFSLIEWYGIDTVFSLHSGVPANALFNTALLVLFAIPLAATYGYFRQGTKPAEPRAAQDVYEGLRRQG